MNWRHQIPFFAKKGFKVIAPDLRGYNTSSKGNSTTHNSVKAAEDIAALIPHFGYSKAYVVGHDWGGVTAWITAINSPSVVKKLVVMNAPHPGVNFSPAQLLRSWYIFFFQIPYISELRVEKEDFSWLISFGFGQSNKHAFALNSLVRYRKAWSQEGAISSMLGYYRHVVKHGLPRQKVTVPTLVLWGEQDAFLLKESAQLSAKEWCEKGQYIYVPDATHWLPQEKPELVNKELAEFFAK